MTFPQALYRLLRFGVTFAAGALLVSGLSLRLWWDSWGGIQAGAGVAFVCGIILTLISILLNFLDTD